MDVKVDLTAILIVTVIFFTTAIIVALSLHFAHRARELRHGTIRVALEKGQPLPLELLEGPRRGAPRRSDLTRGGKAAFLGVGISLFFYLLRPELWPVGLIVLFRGWGSWPPTGSAGAQADAPTAG